MVLLADSITQGTANLTLVDLSFCGLDDTGVVILANSLQQTSSLQCLNLRGNAITLHGVGYLSLAAQANTTVKSVELSKHTMTTEDLLEFGLPLRFFDNQLATTPTVGRHSERFRCFVQELKAAQDNDAVTQQIADM
jgi:hypothetical protein